MCHQIIGGGKGEAEFLDNVGAGVVDVAATDGKHTEFGKVGLGKFHQFFGLLIAMLFATLELSVEQGMAVDVVVATAFDLLGVKTALFDQLDKHLQDVGQILAAGEVHFAGFEVDVLEQLAHIVDVLHFASAETDAVGATVQCLDGQSVGFGQAVGLDVLTNVPDIVVSMFATGEGSLAGVAVEVFQVFEVFGPIVGLHFETFDGFPDQFFLIVGAFEVLDDDFLPFFGRHRWEFAEQFIVFHYVVFLLYSIVKKQRYDFFCKRTFFFRWEGLFLCDGDGVFCFATIIWAIWR